MLRKIAFGLIAVAVLWFGVRAIVHALVSDATLIRWKLEDACEGFDNTRMSPILDFLAHDYVDQPTGGHRDDVRASVAGAFFTEKDPKTRKFPFRAVVVPDTLAIDVEPANKKTAELRCTLHIVDTSGGGERIASEMHLTGKLVKGDEGWQLVETMHEKAIPSLH